MDSLVLSRGYILKSVGINNKMYGNKTQSIYKTRKRAIESMKNQIVEAKRNAKSIIDGAKRG